MGFFTQFQYSMSVPEHNTNNELHNLGSSPLVPVLKGGVPEHNANRELHTWISSLSSSTQWGVPEHSTNLKFLQICNSNSFLAHSLFDPKAFASNRNTELTHNHILNALRVISPHFAILNHGGDTKANLPPKKITKKNRMKNIRTYQKKILPKGKKTDESHKSPPNK